MKKCKVKKALLVIGVAVVSMFVVYTAVLAQDSLEACKKAKIDWTQFKGEAISVLTIPHAYGLALEPYIGEFEKLTGIKANVETIGHDEMRRKRTIDMSMGTGLYDVSIIGLSIIPQYAKANWLVDLKPYINNPKLTDQKWYNYEGVGAPLRKWNTTEDGRIIAVPVNSSGPAFWYRTDIFKKYGFKPPDTWEELVDLKKKLQAKLDADKTYKGMYAFVSRGWTGAGCNTWTICPAIFSFGGSIFDEDMKAVFNSPAAVKALEVYRDAQVGYGSPPGSAGIDLYTIMDMFASGMVASAFEGYDFIVLVDDPKKSKVYDSWECALPPRGPVGRYSSLWTWAFGINYASRHKDASWLFVQWASCSPIMAKMGPLCTPSRLDMWDTEPFKKLKEQEWVKTCKWYVQNGTVTEPLIPEFREAGEAISLGFSKILEGQPVQASLDAAVEEVDKIMAKRKAYEE